MTQVRLPRLPIRVLFMAALLAPILSACGSSSPTSSGTVGPAGSSSASSARGGRLVVTQTEETRDLRSIDPLKSMDTPIPGSLVFDALLRPLGDGTLEPALAASYEQTNPLTWRFHLRPGVHFHDGAALSAADVKATVDRILDPAAASGFQRFVSTVSRADVIDDVTIDLVTKVPNGLLPASVALIPILSSGQLGPAGNSYQTHLNGTGPYTLADWKQGESVTVKRNPNYWGAAPQFDEITVKAVAEPSTRVADLLSGNAQLLADLPPELVSQIKGHSGYRVVREPGVRTGYLTFAFKPPFDDPRVRQAVYHAIDRKALAQAVYGEYAIAATGPVPPSFGGYVEAFPLTDYNPAKSKQLLQDAGVKLPFQVDLDVPQSATTAAQVIQSQLKAVGIQVQINPFDLTSSVVDAKRVQALSKGHVLMVAALDNRQLDAVRPYEAFYSRNSFIGPLGYQLDPRHQALFEQYTAATSPAERTRISGQILTLAQELMPSIYLFFPDQLYGLGPQIDWKPSGLGQVVFSDIKPK